MTLRHLSALLALLAGGAAHAQSTDAEDRLGLVSEHEGFDLYVDRLASSRSASGGSAAVWFQVRHESAAEYGGERFDSAYLLVYHSCRYGLTRLSAVTAHLDGEYVEDWDYGDTGTSAVPCAYAAPIAAYLDEVCAGGGLRR